MSDVDDAIARAADNSPTGNLRGTQAIADRAILAAEVKRLREENAELAASRQRLIDFGGQGFDR